MRRITLEADRLIISFPYHPRLVDVVRELPERRFDRASKTWSVPSAQAAAAVAALGRFEFEIAPEVAALLGGAVEVTRAAGAAEATLLDALSLDPPAGADDPTLRVSQLNARVKRAVRSAFPEEIWVAGEIAGFDRNRQKRHAYFELVEKAEGEEKPRARVSAVLFEGTRPEIARRLAEADDPFELTDGIEVRFRVRVDLYEASGSYQVIVEDVDPIHTLGKLALARREILRTLTERRLIEKNRARPLPELPLRVGVITAWQSDAMNDVLKELEQSGFSFAATFFDARMQGPELKRTVTAGLRWFARRAHEYDVLVIARGGGARTDLVWFDDLDLAVAVAEHPLKVICGIGHQRDESVLDVITTAVKTPTAAAALLVERLAAVESRLTEGVDRLHDASSHHLREARARLQQTGGRIATATEVGVRAARRELGHRAGAVVQGARAALRAARTAAVGRADRFRAAVRVAVALGRRRVEGAVRVLSPDRLRARTERASERVAALEGRLRALDPARVLARGFAIVKDNEGRIVTDAAAMEAGHAVSIGLRDGRLEAEVTEVVRNGGAAGKADGKARQDEPQDAQEE